MISRFLQEREDLSLKKGCLNASQKGQKVLIQEIIP